MISDAYKDSRPPFARSFFISTVALAAGAVETAILPSANVNGIWLARADMATAGAGGAITHLIIATSAPASYNVAGNILRVVTASSGPVYFTQMGEGIMIPPGFGVYFVAQLAESSATRSLAYTIL